MSCIITKWVGRFGNNIIQIAKAIQVCETENINIIVLPKHDPF
jgi:hypothetical protein